MLGAPRLAAPHVRPALGERPPTPFSSSAPMGAPQPAHLVDTTMLFAPRSGGVKRYLLAKRAWLARHRDGVRHSLVVPGSETGQAEQGMMTIGAPRLPFGDGYRWPTSSRAWADRLVALRPSLIEAGDPYGPGAAAIQAGARCGAPVLGFCHTDPAALAALHIGAWAEPVVRRRWASLFNQFDQVIAPSRFIAERMTFAGVSGVEVEPLGVDTTLFRPDRGERAQLLRRLGLGGEVRLLVFAGRPAREKNIDIMLEAAAQLGDDYHLLLIGAGAGARPQSNATLLPFQRDPVTLARLLASCDAFVHANPNEPFGLAVLEGLASGLPIIGMATGGVGELVDFTIGQLAPRATATDLAEAIDALWRRDLHALSLAARRRAVSRHSWMATFDRLSARYAALSGSDAFLPACACATLRLAPA